MLVLTRRVGDKILIGADIEILIVQVSGGKVRVGIRAPQGVPVVRPDLRADVTFADVPVLHTSGGVELTEDRITVLADDAEEGFDLTKLRRRPR